MEIFLAIFSGIVLEPKNGTPEWSRMRQDAARMRKDLDPARSSPPSVRMSCRKGLETPLAAGLAAGAGGLRSLEVLAVHPWAQEFVYAAIYCLAMYFLGTALFSQHCCAQHASRS